MKETLENSFRYDRENEKVLGKASSVYDLNSNNNLNSSFCSNVSKRTINRRYNIKENMNFDFGSMTRFQEFLTNYQANKNILLFVDSNHNVWEIIKRFDININSITNNDNLISIVNYNNNNNNSNNKFFNIDDTSSKFLNIEIKDNYDNRSMNTCELDVSKITDFNNMSIIHDDNLDKEEEREIII